MSEPPMVKRTLVVLLCAVSCSLSVCSKAQTRISAEAMSAMQQMEDSLILVADSMYSAFIPDERPIYCEKFVKQLVRALKNTNSFEYPFTKLAGKINIIAPEDKSFRIFNWLLLPAENQVRYYGAIQMPGESLRLYPLVDYTKELGKSAEDSILRNSKWYGALYYKILATEVNGERVYTLFGLNASSPISNRKVLDPLRLTDKGPVFGAQIFNVSSMNNTNQRINRYVMEYKKEVQASMNWDEEQKIIYFDRLVSQINDPNRKYTFVPSGQYDGFRWDKGQWNYIQDLIPIQNFKDGEAPAPKPLTPKE